MQNVTYFTAKWGWKCRILSASLR